MFRVFFYKFLLLVRDILFFPVWLVFKKNNDLVYYSQYSAFYIMMFKNIQNNLKKKARIVVPNNIVKDMLNDSNIISSTKKGFPKFIIVSDFNDGFYTQLGVKYINIGHGIGEKNYTYKRKPNKKISLHLVSGEYIKNKLLSIGINEEKIKVVGMPKLDDFYNGNLIRNDIFEKHGLDPNKKTVLYCPTCRDDINSLPIFAESFRQFDDTYNVIVKLHPGYDPKLRDDGIKWINLFNSMKNVYLAPFEDTMPFLYIADILITDLGSTMFEFATLDRPIILLNRKDMRSGLGGFDPNGIEQKFRDVGFEINDPQKLLQTVEYCLSNSLENSEKRRYYSEILFYKNDGLASKRAVDEIRKFTKLGV